MVSAFKQAAIAYGHVVHYNPSRTHLSLMLPWTTRTCSPMAGGGGGFPELVVNQTVDLEPQLRLPSQTTTVYPQPNTVGGDFPGGTGAERSSLSKCSNCPKWSLVTSLELVTIHQATASRANTCGSSQIDLICLYALTQSEAEKTWSPSQEVLADLNDGRWGSFAGVSGVGREHSKCRALKTDSDRLWNRVKAALRVNPERPEVLAWGR